jgi:ribosomal protein S12 methylthiotransferase accessory factor
MTTLAVPPGITPLSVSLATLRKLHSPYTGIVRVAFDMLTSPSDPEMWHVTCVSTNSSLTLGAGAPEISGGINPSRERALAAALGEAAERYSASYVPTAELIFAPADGLAEPHVDPALLRVFSDEQLAASDAYARFDRSTPVQWVRGTNLHSGEPTWIPSAYCYLPDHRVPGEPRIAYGTTSGVACALTHDEALLSALYELVERDAFMLMWYNRLSLPVVPWSSSPELQADYHRYYKATGLHVRSVDLSAFLNIPTAVTLVRDDTGFIRLALGAASARTIADAIGKSTREAVQTYRWARQMRISTPDWQRPRHPSEIRTFPDHVLLHAFGEHDDEAAFIDASSETRLAGECTPVSGPSVSEQLAAVTAILADRGMDAYSIDITAPDLRELGLHVVRAVCPQLVPLDADHNFRYLGAPRLRTGAYEAGLLPRPMRVDEFNTFPHPFP